MKISIGSDHRGFMLKEAIKKHLKSYELLDVGTDNNTVRVDYPKFAKQVCEKVLKSEAERGILLCGSGVGASIAANRFRKIYAALCWSPEVARAAREHDCANVLVLPADFVTTELACEIIDVWLVTECKEGRYRERLNQVDE